MTISKSTILTDALIISIFTATGYFASYVRELGFCNYYNIPLHLIEVNTSSIMSSVIILFFVAFGLSHLVTGFTSVLNMGNIVVRKVFSYGLIFGMFFIFAALDGYSFIGTLMFLIIMIGNMIDDFVLPLRHKQITGYANKMLHQSQLLISTENTSPLLLDRISSIMEPKLFIWIPVIFLILLLSNSYGKHEAQKQTSFLATQGNSQVLILKQYGSTFVGVTVDSNKRIENSLYLIDKSNIGNYGSLNVTNIGYILPNKAMKM